MKKLMSERNKAQTLELDCDNLAQMFQDLFGRKQPRFFYAPGRVNLIGEHTDYNEGFVLPIAIERGTLVAGLAAAERTIRVFSLSESVLREFSLDAHEPLPEKSWINYVEGVARSLEESGFRLQGADLLIASDVPVGAGLSSSAALENSVAFALLSLSGYREIDRVKMALAGQSAEHRYVGTQCGIMDQFITAMGQADHALLIDCRSLETRSVPLNLPGKSIVICDSRAKHSLASSAYNQRVKECRRGVECLKQALPYIHALRDVSIAQFKQHQGVITDEIVLKRVCHVITENARTLAAAEALETGQFERLGQLMNESHESLKSDYEVSTTELDTLVEIAQGLPGVYGARMTGGGFGGCTVNLVDDSAVENFITEITRQYMITFDQPPYVYVTRAAEGAHEVGVQSSSPLVTENLSQDELSQQLNDVFRQAFQGKNLVTFTEFVNQQIPPVISNGQTYPAAATLWEQGVGLPEKAEIRVNDIRLTVSREFGIRLYYQGRQLTTDQENIPSNYPWFLHDPEDPEDIAGYATRHVARGSRGESPWPESQWPQVGGVLQGEQNWPHQEAAFGPYRLELAEDGNYKSILLSLPDEKPNAYGVIPKGLFTITPAGAIIMALQHENHSQDLSWSPWFVLGFGMPGQGTIKNPSTILAFPDVEASDPVQDHMDKVWNYMRIGGQKIALINPHAKTLNEPYKKLYRNTNWSVIASKGWDYFILTRSVLRHEEQFFPFLEHGQYFIEIEHTGPRISKGETSTVLIQHDVIPIRQFTEGKVDSFSQDSCIFQKEVLLVLEQMVYLGRTGALLSNYKQAM